MRHREKREGEKEWKGGKERGARYRDRLGRGGQRKETWDTGKCAPMKLDVGTVPHGDSIAKKGKASQ